MKEIKKKRRGPSPMPEVKRQAIIDALQITPNTMRVAKQFGDVSQTAVWKIAKEAGIEVGERGSGQSNPRRMPEPKREAIIDELRKGLTLRQVAQEVGDVSHEAVRKIAKEAGFELGKPGSKSIHEVKRQDVIDALHENPNASQVAKRVGGVSRASVSKIAKKASVELGLGKMRGNAVPEVKRQAIIDALKENPNTAQVARALGDVSVVTVWRVAKEAGVDLRRGRPKKANTNSGPSC